MKTVLQCALLVFCVLLGNLLVEPWGWSVWEMISPAPDDAPPPPAEPDERSRELRVLGRLTPTHGIINLSATPGDRLKSLNVSEGDQVQAGTQLATLESETLRQLEVEAAEEQLAQATALRDAEIKAAEARLRASEKALEQAQAKNPQLEQQKRQVELAALNLAQAEAELKRVQELRADLVAVQEQEQLELLVEKARIEKTAAETALDQLQQADEFQLQTARSEYEVALAGLDQVKTLRRIEPYEAKLKLAQYQHDQTILTAPSDGTILAIPTRPGESVTPEPILQMADTSEMSCIAEVHKSAVDSLSVGQRVRIESDAFEGRQVAGEIVRIGNQVDPPQLRNLDPLAPQNRHVVEVLINIDEGVANVSNLIDLQVDVVILPRESHDGETGDDAQ